MKRVRRIAFWAAVLVLLIAVLGQAQVLAGGDQRFRKDFAIVGQVVEVDLDSGCVYVKPVTGFGPLGMYLGDDAPPLPLHTDSETGFSPKGTSLETIVGGDELRATGTVTDGVFLAERIVIVF